MAKTASIFVAENSKICNFYFASKFGVKIIPSFIDVNDTSNPL